MIQNLIKVLSDGEVERIHEESLQVLQRVGLRVPHPRVLELCRKAGALVDDATQTVRIPTAVIEALLAHCRPAEQPAERPVATLGGGIAAIGLRRRGDLSALQRDAVLRRGGR